MSYIISRAVLLTELISWSGFSVHSAFPVGRGRFQLQPSTAGANFATGVINFFAD